MTSTACSNWYYLKKENASEAAFWPLEKWKEEARNFLEQSYLRAIYAIFPEYGDGFIKQIDYSVNYVDTLIDDFSTKEKLPQIAVSVDMLDTGIDIPEILNLVFFKKVRSYSRFWQMIGRGTRLCKDLFGPGIDKDSFLIFDFCNNFEFFRADGHGSEGKIPESISEKIFSCKVEIIRQLQAPDFQKEDYREKLVKELNRQVIDLNDRSFRVREHYRQVETYRDLNAWKVLETAEVNDLKKHIAPLIVPADTDELARRFDYVVLSIELADLENRNAGRGMKIVTETAELLSRLYTIPQVKAQQTIIEKVRDSAFWDEAGILDMEQVREALRSLIQYIEKAKQKIYYIDIGDKIISEEEGTSLRYSNDLKSYRQKVESYLKEHGNTTAVYKLRHNRKMTQAEMNELERILWQELGSKEEYQKEYGETPVGRLVRKIVGVDRTAVNEAFSEFLDENRLNLNQIRFVKLMVDYIVANGNIEDNSVLMKEPFRSAGSITVLFKNDMLTAKKILQFSADIRMNSETTA